MENVSLKEKALVGGLLVVVLYLVLVLLWFLKFHPTWNSTRKDYEEQRRTVEKEERLCSERAHWDEVYDQEVGKIKKIDQQNADVYWKRAIVNLAKQHHVQLEDLNTEPGADIDVMGQMTIKATWTGALSSLVNFLHELEGNEVGNFDVLQLDIRPAKEKQGFLRGTIKLACVYRRAEHSGE